MKPIPGASGLSGNAWVPLGRGVGEPGWQDTNVPGWIRVRRGPGGQQHPP